MTSTLTRDKIHSLTVLLCLQMLSYDLTIPVLEQNLASGQLPNGCLNNFVYLLKIAFVPQKGLWGIHLRLVFFF